MNPFEAMFGGGPRKPLRQPSNYPAPAIRQGDVFTIGPNKNCQDRSYTDLIFECMAINESHVVGKVVWQPEGIQPGSLSDNIGQRKMFLHCEHDIFDASELLASLKPDAEIVALNGEPTR